MSANNITYQYASASGLKDDLFLSKFSEDQRLDAPCFFWGKLNDSFLLARCLITLSKTVQSSFSLSPFQLALLKDPVVTAGNGLIRFEGFSHCAGAYARVDVLEDGHDGEFLANGTTNVDFNTPLITALAQVQRREELVLSVGKKAVGFHQNGKSIIERKVPLPTKWIKGLTTVQHFMAEAESPIHLNKLQAQQLFRTLPKGKVKADYYLVARGKRYAFSPVESATAVCIGGIHRLQLLLPLLPLINGLSFYPHPEHQATTIVLAFDRLRFTFSISRNSWRGFSGEGATLDHLIEDLPDQLFKAFDNYAFTNQAFNPTAVAIREDIDLNTIESLSARLAAIGLLGYDLERNHHFYRRLPFKLSRILSLNPRLKGVEKLLAEGKVRITQRENGRIAARVAGSGVDHYVVVSDQLEKCTCLWYSRNQGERGPCKHILATKKLAMNE